MLSDTKKRVILGGLHRAHIALYSTDNYIHRRMFFFG